MKLLDITLKDLNQASRSRTIYFFMFVVPIGISLLFMLMFGGIGDDEGFQLAPVQVLVVNQDQGKLPEGFSLPGIVEGEDSESFDSMGALLVEILKSPDFSQLLRISENQIPERARAAVDSQTAGVAVVLPPDFTDSLLQPGGSTSVELYKDPTLSIGPQIVEAIVTSILDNFDAATIGLEVTMTQLAERGVALSGPLVQEVAVRITNALSGQGEADSPDIMLVTVRPPTTDGPETDLLTEIVGTILGGMMIFFAFFTAASTVETILVEEERGTLARLFTTPTSHRAILGGKGFSAVVILVFQLTVLMSFGAIALKIHWGTFPAILLAALGIILAASATGIFLVSLMQNTRQGGIIFGGVLTMTGMLGLIPVFTSGNPDQPDALGIVSLLVPQGWAMRGLGLSMDGASVTDMLPVFGVIFLWSLVLFFIGQYRMRRRFA